MIRPISATDEEHVRTVSLMSRMKGKEGELRAALRHRFEENPDDDEAALCLGLFNMLLLGKSDVMHAMLHVETALEAFNRILSRHPDYWLVRAFKIRILVQLPSNFRDDEDIAREIDLLIERQRQSHPQPYFILTHVLAADFYYCIGQKKKAMELLEDGTTAIPRQPVTTMPDFLVLPLVGFYGRLKNSADHEMANRIAALGRTFFPGEPFEL